MRNIQGCHLAGACPQEVLDITQWAEAAFQHFVRNPLGQRLPRKFKINFSGCAHRLRPGDVQRRRRDRRRRARCRDGEVERGFRVYIAGGLGANPHPALALEEFTSREDLLPTIEAILRVFDQTGNRDNKLRARLKWVVDTLGFDEVQRRVLKIRHLLPASSSWPGGIPPRRRRSTATRPPASRPTVEVTPVGQGVEIATPVAIGDLVTVRALAPGERRARRRQRHRVGRTPGPRSATSPSDQFRALAAIQRELERRRARSPTARTSCSAT